MNQNKKTVREWRKEKGLSTDYVADKLGIKRETLTRKERNDDFTLFQLKLLCELFKIELEQIY